MFFEPHSEKITHFIRDLRKRHFPAVPENIWTYKIEGDALLFGHAAEDRSVASYANPSFTCLFKLLFEKGVLSFSIVHCQSNYTPAIADFYPDILVFIENTFDDCLFSQFFERSHRELPSSKDRVQYYAFGPKAEKAIELLSGFYDYFTLICEHAGVYGYNPFFKDQVFLLNPDLTGSAPSITMKWIGGKLKNTDSLSFQTTEEVRDYIRLFEKEKTLFETQENKLLETIYQADPTAYYDRNHAQIYIFQIPVLFKLNRKEHKTGFTWIVQFHRHTIQSLSLETLMQKATIKIADYLLKHRLKAVTSGKTMNWIPQFYFEITNQTMSRAQFMNEKLFIDFTENMEALLPFIDYTQKEHVSDNQLASFQTQIKKAGYQHQLKYGIRFGELLAFVSASSIFITSESLTRSM